VAITARTDSAVPVHMGHSDDRSIRHDCLRGPERGLEHPGLFRTDVAGEEIPKAKPVGRSKRFHGRRSMGRGFHVD